MAIDFAHPVIADLYSSGTGTDWPGYLQDNIAAVASWLDGVDPPGKRVGFKRISGGQLQQWNGSAWVALALSLGSVTLGPPLTITSPGIVVPSAVWWVSAGGPLVWHLQSTSNAANDYSELRVVSNDVAGHFTAYHSAHSSRANQVWLQAFNPSATLVLAQNNIHRMRIDTSGRVLMGPGNEPITNGNGLEVVGAIRSRGPISGYQAGYTSVDLGTIAGYPVVDLICAQAAVDAKAWVNYADNSGSLHFQCHNDAFSAGYSWLDVTRSGATPNTISFYGRVGVDKVWNMGVPGIDVAGGVRASGSCNFLLDVGYTMIGASTGNPHQVWVNIAGPTDSKVWDSLHFTQSIAFRLLNDARTASNTWMSVTRFGYTPANVQLFAPLGFGAAPGSGHTVDMMGAGGGGGSIGGVNNIAGASDAGAYTIWAGRSTINGAYVQLFGSAHATNANMLILGTANTGRVVIDSVGNVNIATGSGSLFVGGVKARFKSAEVEPFINANSIKVFAHGAGRAPDLVQVFLKNLVADAGYVPGDEVLVNHGDVGDPSRQLTLKADATNISVGYAASTNQPMGLRLALSSATYVAITTANWKLFVRAHWL